VTEAPVGFPVDWLEAGLGRPATDLDLTVLLVNSLDALDDPPDRLHDLRWLDRALRAVGQAELADDLTDADLPALRRLRDRLRAVFEAADDGTVRDVLNPLLVDAAAVPVLTPTDHGFRLAVAPDRRGINALAARLPAALAAFVADRGVRRLGTCAAGPCSCAFVDRTRGGTRRFCCSYCNDRAAARNYRARRRKSPGTDD
jgi:predicted RNA-binding Zn ribbon-like protein